jgi:hypothetical protein
VLSALSRAVGTPAFSISQLRFIFIEGAEGVGERERFRKLGGLAESARFMECGSGNEVCRRVATIQSLAGETEAGIRIGGVVDRDFKTDAQVDALSAKGIFALPVHEVENFFLHAPTVTILLTQNGQPQTEPEVIILAASDARAGSWIFQHTMATDNAKSLPDLPSPAKERADIDADRNAAIQSIVALTRFGEDDARKFAQILAVSANAYSRKRIERDLWKQCEGKQVLSAVAHNAGYAGPPAFMAATFALYARAGAEVPAELLALRTYLTSL